MIHPDSVKQWEAETENFRSIIRQQNEETARLRALLMRCETILSNLALENEGAIFNRWPISPEPLRADAKGLLPEILQALDRTSHEHPNHLAGDR